MTDADQDSRLAALAARRGGDTGRRQGAATKADTGAVTAHQSDLRPSPSRPRHAATGARILAGALSVSATIVFAAAMAQAARSSAAPIAPSTPTPPAVVQLVPVVSPTASTGGAVPAAARTTPTIAAAPATVPATATTRGS